MLCVCYLLSYAMLVCMLAYRIPIVCSLLAFYLPFFSFEWLAECFRAVFMLSAYRSACRMLAAFILFAEFADSVACRMAHCQHAVVRVAIMLSASRHAFRMERDGSLCAWRRIGMSACCSPYACLPVRYFLLILFSSRLFADIISGTGAGIFLCPLEYHYTVLYTRKDDSI